MGELLQTKLEKKLKQQKENKPSNLKKVEHFLALPMLFLSFVWLCVLLTELVSGTSALLSQLGTNLWILFVLYFVLRLFIAANKQALLKKNWLFILAIGVSILRFIPDLQNQILVRGLTLTFGIQVIWIFVSADQGIRFVRRALGKRGAGYVVVLTLVIIFTGSAGILYFESQSAELAKIQSYPIAVWWTAMQMTNIGSSYVIKTTGAKIICLGISIYSAGMFGYLTALFAALIIDRDKKPQKSEGLNQIQFDDLKLEIEKIRISVESLKRRS